MTDLTSTREVRPSDPNARRPCYIPDPIGMTLQNRLRRIRRPSLGLLPVHNTSSKSTLLQSANSVD